MNTIKKQLDEAIKELKAQGKASEKMAKAAVKLAEQQVK
jgi:hypothetical protein